MLVPPKSPGGTKDLKTTTIVMTKHTLAPQNPTVSRRTIFILVVCRTVDGMLVYLWICLKVIESGSTMINARSEIPIGFWLNDFKSTNTKNTWPNIHLLLLASNEMFTTHSVSKLLH